MVILIHYMICQHLQLLILESSSILQLNMIQLLGVKVILIFLL